MLTDRKSWLGLSFAGMMIVGIPAAYAQQQTTGTPGSPSATTTIDGKYLPPPPAPFGGTINLDAKDSKPYWPPTVVPPKGAPNVLLIMTDDQGYGMYEHLWRCHPDAVHGPHRESRTALHAVPLNCSLLADASGADHRPQPSLGGLRRDHRNVHRISRGTTPSSGRRVPPSVRS